ncbi:MAG: hypothetical protein N3D11_17435 [Candidatus Sumerlaeia bacterium]|nr:hypothetical protein [Candidatus Sumerlaeia bacterium]
MIDCCEDKTSPYEIRPEDAGLINAAIALGEQLYDFPEATLQQREAISQMLTFLRRLPAPPPPELHGEFGFELQPDNDSCDGGHFGCWSVSVCRAMFEIFSCGQDDFDEFSWNLCPGHPNRNELSKADTWIKQTSNPRALMLPGQRLVIEASTWSVKD